MRFLHIIILGLFATLTLSFQGLDDERTRPIEQLLKELDDAIVHKQHYQQQTPTYCPPSDRNNKGKNINSMFYNEYKFIMLIFLYYLSIY